MFRLLIVVLALLLPSVSLGSDWTRSPGGYSKCGDSVSPGSSCYNAGDTDTPVLATSACSSWMFIAYGTALTVMPQTCTSKAGTVCENLLSTALTGDPPNTFVASEAPVRFFKATVSGVPTSLELVCRRR